MSAPVSADKVRAPPFLFSMRSDWSTPSHPSPRHPLGARNPWAKSHLGNRTASLGSQLLGCSLSFCVLWLGDPEGCLFLMGS